MYCPACGSLATVLCPHCRREIEANAKPHEGREKNTLVETPPPVKQPRELADLARTIIGALKPYAE